MGGVLVGGDANNDRQFMRKNKKIAKKYYLKMVFEKDKH